MARRRKDPLRDLTDDERRHLTRLRRSTAAPALHAARAGGGWAATYGADARDRILREAARTPTPDADGTATWSLMALRRVLRAASDGLPAVSTYTIWRVLREAGYTFQKTR